MRIERRQDYAGALEQFDKIIEIAQKKKDDGRLADAFRLKGLAYKDKGEVGNAREAIKKSLEIERARLSYGGIATAEEQLGDLYALRTLSIGTARRWYLASVANYRTANDGAGVKRVRRKVNALRTEETLLSRALERFARLMLRAAKRLRVQAQMTS